MASPVPDASTTERILDGAHVLLTGICHHPRVPDATASLPEPTLHYFDVRRVTRVFDLHIDHAGR